jgi:hypothetical protein
MLYIGYFTISKNYDSFLYLLNIYLVIMLFLLIYSNTLLIFYTFQKVSKKYLNKNYFI